MWFVIHVKPGTETQAVSLLKSTSKSDALQEVFCPMVEYTRRDHGKLCVAAEPMFEGKVFAVAPSKWELRACMQKAPELEVLYSRNPGYDAMEPGEEEFINAWAAMPNRVCALSEGEVGEDNTLTITSGPLLGHESEVAKYSCGRRWAYLDTCIAGEPARAHVGIQITRNDSPNHREQLQEH